MNSSRTYKFLKKIGSGGFGEVYLAEQAGIDRRVAIKRILPHHANDDEFVKRFDIEAQIVARLEHPSIVPLFDYWRDNNGAYLVMRYLPGGSLADSLKQGGAWSLAQTDKLVSQIAEALYVAHQNQVIHQDLKPGNILLDDLGNAYLTDFGIARDLVMDVNLAIDPDMIVHGSPAYISPEYLDDVVTHKSDIYGLGILLYEILTGVLPFSGPVDELLNHQKHTPLPRLQLKQPDLPEALNYVLRKATAKNPNARYDDTLQLAREFHDVFLGIETPRSDADPRALQLLQKPLTNPYKSLRPFQEADASDFYGREKLVQDIIGRLSQTGPYHRFLAVIGPSGSGKSSVVKAGVLPLVRAGSVAALPDAFITEMTPGPKPMRALAGALLNVARRADETFIDELQHDDFSLLAMARRAVRPKDTILLFIDQFEEIFTLTESDAERDHFLHTLHEAITTEASPIRVIVTLRADFYDRPLAHPDWGPVFSERNQSVVSMTLHGLQAAIAKPAEKAGVTLETALVEQIIEDFERAIGALPLLQYALSELFERRSGLELTLAAYETLGGLSGALARRANEIMDGLTAQERLIAQRIFPRLVKLGEGADDTRHRVPLPDLLSIAQDRALVQDVLDLFVEGRLLTYNRDLATRIPTVEIAHEALIHSWDLLEQWLKDNRRDLERQERLARATQEWLDNKRDPSYLAAGKRLVEFEDLPNKQTVALNRDERTYLEASIRRARRQANRRRFVTALFGLMALTMSILALVAAVQRQRATVAREAAVAEAQISNSRALAAAARNEIANPDLAALLAVEAYAIEDTYEARNSLLTVLQNYWRLRTTLHGHADFVRTVTTNPDQSILVSGGRDGEVRVWDAATLHVRHTLSGHEEWVNHVAVSPDSRKIASASRDNTVRVWDVETGAPIATLDAHNDEARSVAFSPDGTQLLSADAQGIIKVWEVDEWTETASWQGHEGFIYMLAFSPDGTSVASAGADNQIILWDAGDWSEQRRLSGHENWVVDVVFSPDGTLLASASADSSVRVWDVATGAAIWAQVAHTDWARAVAFSEDGTQLYSGGDDGVVRVWDVATRTLVDGFRNVGNAQVWDVTLLHDAILLAGLQPALNLWDRQPVLPLQEARQTLNHPLAHLAVSEAGWWATASDQDEELTITLLHATTQDRQTLVGNSAPITGLAYWGSRLVSANAAGQLLIWDEVDFAGEISVGQPLFGLAISQHTLALGTNNGAVLIWDAPDDLGAWAQRTTLQAHTRRILDLAFSSDGSRLASSSRDGAIIVWDMATGERLYQLRGHNDGVQTLAFSPDGALLASGSRDQTIILWDMTTGEAVGDVLSDHQNWVLDVAFSPDGTMLASGSGDETVMLWDVARRVRLGQPFTQGHTDWVNQVAFSPDGRQLFSGGLDETLIVRSVDLDGWQARACAIANRRFTEVEVSLYFETAQPQDTCRIMERDAP